MGFWDGEEGKYKKINQFDRSQQNLQNQNVQAGSGSSLMARNYYNELLNGNNNYNALSAPQLRQFNEEIIPDLSEQFAGMGSGALSSSGFRNAAVNAGTDLSERLGSIRAQLRNQGAQGLMQLGQQGLNPHYENVYEQPQPGFGQTIAPIAGGIIGSIAGGPIGGMIGSGLGNMAGSAFGNGTKASPYKPGNANYPG